MSNKVGFWPLLAIVIGSQIGSGVFMLPASLAPFGYISIFGWIAAGLGAISLALVYAGLSKNIPKTGGPHAYVNSEIGPVPAFFTGWSYWVVSWVSTSAVIITSISYLSSFMSEVFFNSYYLYLEIGLLLIIAMLNLKGVSSSGKAEFFLTVIKAIPLIVIPSFAIMYFELDNLTIESNVSENPLTSNLAKVTLSCLWGFVGLECATTPAGSVINPSRTIPRAIIIGTICTAIIYFFNSVAIMGLTPSNILAESKAPYSDAARVLFSGDWHMFISIFASIVCVGTLNAWILASSQISLGLAQDGFMPEIFASTNKNGAPIYGIIISSLGIIPFLILTANESTAKQINQIIDFSVVTFLYVYIICIVAYLKILIKTKASFYHYIYSFISFVFCLWVLSQTDYKTLLMAGSFVVTGIPMYLLWYRKKKNIKSE